MAGWGDWFGGMGDAASSAGNAIGNAASGVADWGKNAANSFGNWFMPQDNGTNGGGPWGAMKPYVQDPRMWMGALGTGLGVGSNIYNWMNQSKLNDQMQRTMKQGPNVNQYYHPMSEEMRKAYSRQFAADAVMQHGTPDGAFMKNLMAESMAKTEGQRWQDAARLASGDWNSKLQTMQGMHGPAPMGDIGAMGNAYSWIQQSRERQAAEQQNKANQERYYKILEGWGKQNQGQGQGPGKGSSTDFNNALGTNTGMTDNRGMSGMSPYSSGDLDMFEKGGT